MLTKISSEKLPFGCMNIIIPMVRYKILFHFLDTPYGDEELTRLRQDFMESDIVEELYEAQNYDGGWGPILIRIIPKAKFPTSMTAIKRCLYIGLTIEDGYPAPGIRVSRKFSQGTSREKLYNKTSVPYLANGSNLSGH